MRAVNPFKTMYCVGVTVNKRQNLDTIRRCGCLLVRSFLAVVGAGDARRPGHRLEPAVAPLPLRRCDLVLVVEVLTRGACRHGWSLLPYRASCPRKLYWYHLSVMPPSPILSLLPDTRHFASARQKSLLYGHLHSIDVSGWLPTLPDTSKTRDGGTKPMCRVVGSGTRHIFIAIRSIMTTACVRAEAKCRVSGVRYEV